MAGLTQEAGEAASQGRPPAIELRNVSQQFRLESGKKVQALDNVSLKVEPGEFLCVLGPSGHGKSTMLNIVAGFLQPNSGEVLAGGKPVTGPGADRGVVFQRDTVFMWKSVADNVAFGMKARGVPKAEREEKVERYLRHIGLEQYGEEWPKQLSGGMRRRVAIATVFANEPDVLLMDEPFVGLDYARRSALHKVLMDLWAESQRSVLFVTHDIDEALALADRIVVVVKGQVVLEERLSMPRPRGVAEITGDEAVEIRGRLLEQLDPEASGVV